MRTLALSLAIVCAGCTAPRGPASVTGIWTGAFGDQPRSIGVRYFLEEQDGQLTGTTAFLDMANPDGLAVDGKIEGARAGAAASWTSESDIEVSGTFDGDSFVGTLQFPPDEGRPFPSAPLKLTR